MGNLEKHEENDKTETKKHGAIFSFYNDNEYNDTSLAAYSYDQS